MLNNTAYSRNGFFLRFFNMCNKQKGLNQRAFRRNVATYYIFVIVQAIPDISNTY